MNDQTPVTKRDLVEQNIDKVFGDRKNDVAVSAGGLLFRSQQEIIDAAKMLSMTGCAVPKWLQGNIGGCWAVILQAIESRFGVMSTAKQSYEVNGVVDYMSQFKHALIEKYAPLKQRLRARYEGEEDQRRCTIIGHITGEVEPLEYTSPPIAKISPKHSPLWKTDPDQQLWYYSTRMWSRRYCPDILLGLPDHPNVDEGYAGPESAKDVTADSEALAQRLAEAAKINGANPPEGFREGVVEKGLEQPTDAPDVKGPPDTRKREKRASDRLQDDMRPPSGGRGSGRRSRSVAQNADAGPKTTSTATTAPPDPERFMPPNSPATYREHVQRWLAQVTDKTTREDIELKWGSERRLRNQCNIVEEERLEIRKLVDAALELIDAVQDGK